MTGLELHQMENASKTIFLLFLYLLFRKCQVENCELCGLSYSRCLSCQDNLVGRDNKCKSDDLAKCSIENCQNCSLIETVPFDVSFSKQ